MKHCAWLFCWGLGLLFVSSLSWAETEVVDEHFIDLYASGTLFPINIAARVGTRFYSIWEAELECNQYVHYLDEASGDKGIGQTRLAKLYLALPWIRIGTGYGYRRLTTKTKGLKAVSNTVIQSFQVGYHFRFSRYFVGFDVDAYRPIKQKSVHASSQYMYLTEREQDGLKQDLYKSSGMMGFTFGYII